MGSETAILVFQALAPACRQAGKGFKSHWHGHMTPLNKQDHLFGKVAVFVDAANIIHYFDINKFRAVWEWEKEQ